MSNLIKQAEKNLVNVCKAHDDIYELVDALTRFCDRYVEDWAGRDDTTQGLYLLRCGLDKSLSANVRKLFTLVGVGGEEAAEYSREKFRKLFGNDEKRYTVMHLLDQYARIPHSYKVDTEKEFRKQGKEVCDGWEQEAEASNE